MNHERLVELVRAMTLEEKTAQLLQLSGDFYSDKAEELTGPAAQLGLTQADIDNAGTILGVASAEECRRIQDSYMKRHRLHIPTLIMGDVIHGCRTIFPIPLAIGSSWNPQTARNMAKVSAREASACGLHVTFSPMVDLVRDPRWGRVMESTGEDPWLNGVMAKAMVEGYQNDDNPDTPLKDFTKTIGACVKHFAAYGAPEGGREYNTVDMSERRLRDEYLNGYSSAINAGAKLTMTSFNTVDGIPATGNKHLMRDILRNELGFKGVLISDFGAVGELMAHGVAADERQAAQLAIEAGVDIEMMSSCYPHELASLVKEDAIPETLVDEAVLRVLELKNDLGLFENPYRGADPDAERRITLCNEHRQAARQAAEDTIVLLKNSPSRTSGYPLLPLRSNDTIALIGPHVSSHDMLGAWSWQGDPTHTVTPEEGMRALSESQILTGHEPFDCLNPSRQAVEEAITLASQTDIAVLMLGETSAMSGEAAARTDIQLPQSQLELFNKVRAVNPNTVVVLFNGRPLDLNAIEAAPAIVEAWFPGTEAGNAIASVLYGQKNPSARLSMSFPFNVGQVPVYYNHLNTGRPADGKINEKYVSKYIDAPNEPKYPFGFGLSYSKFEYGKARVSAHQFSAEKPLTISIDVTNTSSVDGIETVQLYIRDVTAEVSRPVKELKSYEQVNIKAGETQTIKFTLDESQVRYVHTDLTTRSDPGEFSIMIGPNSRDLSEPITVWLE